nr:MAG: major capsid protein [Gokushovirinae sp.]
MLQRNKSSNFSLLPEAHIQRSVFDRSSSHKFTFNVGELIPFYVDEVLPGSTHQIRTSKMVRLQTPATPFMDDLYLDTYYFFVPNRLIWDKWKEFQGENNNSHWIPSTEYTVPQITLPKNDGIRCVFPIGSIADYMGLPAGNLKGSFDLPDGTKSSFQPLIFDNTNAVTFNALPFRAYALICNDWFRDQNLSDPLWVPTSSGVFDAIYDYPDAPSMAAFGNTEVLKRQALGGRPYQVCKYHDYFTSALPSPLKGDPVKVPVTRAFTERPLSPTSLLDYPSGANSYYIKRDSSGALVTTTEYTSSLTLDSTFLREGYAGISINDLRLAFATQAQYERDARGGTRYTEILRSNFGVISPDASLQRSQYLGGNHFRINVNQVVQQSSGGADKNSFLGDVAAFSATADSNGDFIQSFTEHGFIIGVCCARYNHSYQQGAERMWYRQNRFDYYMPAFANIGEQAIKYGEIFLDPSNSTHIDPQSVFGYQEAWAEYRMKPNRVSGEMRSICANTLDYWHLADKYLSPPYLSDSWIREDPNNVDRVLTVNHTVSNQIFADFYIDNKTTQPIPMYSIPATLGGNF